MGRGAQDGSEVGGAAVRAPDIAQAVNDGLAWVDVFEVEENNSGEAARIRAAIYFAGCPRAFQISDWQEIATPGNEDSYDDALAAAVSESESGLVDALVNGGMDRETAEDLVGAELNRSDMPVL